MKQLFLFLFFAVTANGFVSGQDTNEFKTAEFFVGYSNSQHGGGSRAATQHGVNISGVYNFTRYFGLKGDFSATFQGKDRTGTFPNDGEPFAVAYKERNSLYNFLGGIQIKDNAGSGRLKPFAHALVGVGHRRIAVSDFRCVPDDVCIQVVPAESSNGTGIAGAFGGGLDIRLSDRIQFRLVQVDYNPVRVYGRTEHNARISTGIVF